MQMDPIIQQLAGNVERIRTLVEGIPRGQARWKPDADSWSVLEVACHLYDEERLDFRRRLEHVLARRDQPWPPIDPEGWVTAHHYDERNLEEVLEIFLEERGKSLLWLRDLPEPDLETSYEAPFGEIKAGDLLAAWAAHDLLHMRQLLELKWGWLEREAAPYRTLYAGEW